MGKWFYRITIICKYCGNSFEVKPHLSPLGKHNIRKFCSKECSNKSRTGIKREFTKEWKEKIINNGKAKKGKKNLKISMALKNSDKAKQLWFKSGKLNPMFGKNQSKELNPNWKGGTTKNNQILRNGMIYNNWRKTIFERDNYTCQKCNCKGIYLQAHHIKSISKFPELIFDINNGITLCLLCHEKIHNRIIGIKQKEK